MNQPKWKPPHPEIDLQIDEAFADQVDQARLRDAVAAALGHEGRPDAELAVIIGDDALLHQLNLDYAGIDAATDVLSFSAQEQAEGQPASFVSAPEALSYLGDVIISLPAAARQAAKGGHSLLDELCLLAVHGVLHLLGYDHASAEGRTAMWAVQASILDQLGIRIDADRQE